MLRNFSSSLFASLYSTILSLAVVPILFSLMGAERYGLIGIYLLLLPAISLLDLGIGVTALRESAKVAAGAIQPAAYVDLIRGLELIFLALFVLFCTLAVALADSFARSWIVVSASLEGEVVRASGMMFICLALRWVSALYRNAVNGFGEITWLSGFIVLTMSLRYVGAAVLMLFAPQRLDVFFAFQILVGVVEALGFAAKSHRLFPRKGIAVSLAGSARQVTKTIGFTAAISAGGMLWVAAAQLDKFLLMPLFSIADYGLFSMTAMLAGGISLLASPINVSLLPVLSRLSALSDVDQYISEYRKYAQMTAVILFPVCSVLAIFSSEIIWIWTDNSTYGAKWGIFLAIYSVANTVLSISIFSHYTLIANNRMKLYLSGIIIFVCFLVSIMSVMLNKLGPVGAAYTWLIVNIAYLTIWVQFVHNRVLPSLHAGWLYFDLVPVAVSAAGAVFLTKLIIPPISTVVGNVLMLVICGSFSLICAALASPYARANIKSYLTRLAS